MVIDAAKLIKLKAEDTYQKFEDIKKVEENGAEARSNLLLVISTFSDDEILKESEYVTKVNKLIDNLVNLPYSQLTYEDYQKLIYEANKEITSAGLKLFRSITDGKEKVLNQFIND